MSEWLPIAQLAAILVNLVLVIFIIPLRSSIDKLTKSDESLNKRLGELEVKLAENYCQRAEVTNGLNELSRKLERIEDYLYTHRDRRIDQ